MADAMLVLEVIGLAGEMRVERLLERRDLLRMHAVHPVLERPMAAVAGRPIIARHRAET